MRFFYFLCGLAIVINLTGLRSVASASPILETRDKVEQCEGVYSWIEVARTIGGAKIFTGTMTAGSQREKAAPAFADDIFSVHFGKTYSALSKSDKKKLIKILRRCSESNTRFYSGGLQNAFQVREDRYPVAKWRREIEKHRSGADALANGRAEAQREAARIQRAKTKKLPTPHRAGKLLAEHVFYKIYAFKRDTHFEEPACREDGLYFQTSVVIQDLGIRLDEAFITQMFEETLYPLADRVCPNLRGNVTAEIFFKDVHMNGVGGRLPDDNFEHSIGQWDRWFMRVQGRRLGPPPRLDRYFFGNKRPEVKDQWAYESFEAFQHLRSNYFKTDREIAATAAAEGQLKQDKSDRDTWFRTNKLAMGFPMSVSNELFLAFASERRSSLTDIPNSLVDFKDRTTADHIVVGIEFYSRKCGRKSGYIPITWTLGEAERDVFVYAPISEKYSDVRLRMGFYQANPFASPSNVNSYSYGLVERYENEDFQPLLDSWGCSSHNWTTLWDAFGDSAIRY